MFVAYLLYIWVTRGRFRYCVNISLMHVGDKLFFTGNFTQIYWISIRAMKLLIYGGLNHTALS